MMLGDRIAQLRISRNLSQKAFANEIGFSDGAVAMWEINKRQPNLETLVKIAQYFHVSTDYLLGIEKTSDINDLSPQDIQIINNFHEANEQSRLAILTLLGISFNEREDKISRRKKNPTNTHLPTTQKASGE